MTRATSRRLRLASVGLITSAWLASLPARADEAVCIAANDRAIELRKSGKLGGAMKELATCAAEDCSEIVRNECSRRMVELRAVMPTFVVRASDVQGDDLVDVRVFVDDALVADKLDGRPIPIDPGSHACRFESSGKKPFELQVVVIEGEKDRKVVVRLGDLLAPAPPPPVAAAQAEPPVEPQGPIAQPAPTSVPPPMLRPEPVHGLDARRTTALVMGGVGLAGIVVGSVFGVLTAEAIGRQKTDCPSASMCPRPAQATSDHSTWTTDGDVSTALFIAGGVLIAGGAVAYFAPWRRTERSSPPVAASVSVDPAVAPGRAGLVLRGRF